jgi:cholesterol transport system auxiliary component
VRGLVVWLLVLAGCALVSRSPALEVRYFSPEPLPAEDAARAPRSEAPAEVRPRVRLGRISPSDYLRQRIVHRATPVEIAMYQARLWTEPPDAYVRRALERSLFAQRGLDLAVGGRAVTLDVEVLAFEEVRAPRHAGRVQLRYRLRDERTVRDTGVVTVERAVAGRGFGAVVAAIGAALGEASSRVADIVVRQLSASPASDGPGVPSADAPGGATAAPRPW